MLMQTRHWTYGCLSLTACFFISGCTVALDGAGGTVAYLKGDLESTEPYGIDKVYHAAKRTLDDLGITVIQDARDALSARIIARDAEDKKIAIRLVSVTEDSTKVSIRISVFGSEEKSQRIYDKMRDRLQSGGQ